MCKRTFAALTILLSGFVHFSLAQDALGDPPLLAQDLARAEELLSQRKFDDCLAALRGIVDRKDEDRATASMAQYRLGEYLGYIKECSRDKQYWLSVVEGELRKVATDFPEQIEAINLSRLKLVDALLGQDKIDEARSVAHQLLTTAQNSTEYQAWGRLKLVEVSLATLPGTEGVDIRAAQLAAIPELEQVVTLARDQCPDVANWARVRLLSTLVGAWQFEPVSRVCEDVLGDHSSGRATDKQAAWALILEASAFRRQGRLDHAIESLEMASAIADPNHLDLKYRAEDDLRVAYRQLVEEYWQQAEAAAKQDDAAGAKAYFEEAYVLSLPAGGFRSDEIAKRLGQIAEKEDIDRAIAWWRLAIRNPADLSGVGPEAAEVVAWLYHDKKKQPDQEERWRTYLLSPGESDDPTAPIVADVLGMVAPGPTGQVSAIGMPDRLVAMGKLYHREKRFDQSKAVFDELLQMAETPAHRADALTGQVAAMGGQAAELRKQGEQAKAQTLVLDAKLMAEEAADLWLNVALAGSCGRSHYATEQAVEGFKSLGLDDQALATANRFVDELTNANAPLSKIAFALLMRMRALAWNGRLAEAAEAGMELEQQVSSAAGPAFEVLHVQALIRASGYYAHSGNLGKAETLLDKVDTLYPGKYDDWLAPYRRMMSRLTSGH